MELGKTTVESAEYSSPVINFLSREIFRENHLDKEQKGKDKHH